MNSVGHSPSWSPPILLRGNDTGTSRGSYPRRSNASSSRTQFRYMQHRSIQAHTQPQPLQQEWAKPSRNKSLCNTKNTDGVHQVSRDTGSRKGTPLVWCRQWCHSAAKIAIHQLWWCNHPLNDTTPLQEDDNQDDHLPEVWVQGRGIRKAVGSNNKHNGLFHRPWQVLNLSYWPRHRNKRWENNDDSGRENVGEQDVHRGPNGCMGEQDCGTANLEESTGLLHRKMARVKTILTCHRKNIHVSRMLHLLHKNKLQQRKKARPPQ